jgi:hypothetical protein
MKFIYRISWKHAETGPILKTEALRNTGFLSKIPDYSENTLLKS